MCSYLSIYINNTRVYYESIKRELNNRLGTVYYETINRDLNKRLIFDSRFDERLKVKAEGCTHLTYTKQISLCSPPTDLYLSVGVTHVVVYYESIKRELKIRCI